MTEPANIVAQSAPTNITPRTPWTLKDMAWASVAAVMFTGLGLLIAIAVAVAGAAINPGDMNLAPYMSVALASEVLLVLPAWVWGPCKYGGGWRALGLRGMRWGRALLMLVIGAALMAAVSVGWSSLLEALGYEGQVNILPMFGEGPGGLAVALVLGGLVAPLAEEVFFRGLIYAGMRSRWGVGWALALSALLFAAVHVSLTTLPALFVMGLILAYLYERTDSLWPSILLHGANNSIAFIALYLAR